MTSTKTIWLLDVDGVINVNQPEWGTKPHHDTARSAGYDWPMRWAPALIHRIRALHNTGLVTITWCTTWCADAEQLEHMWKLPPLDRAFTEAINGPEAAAAKLAAARKVIANGDRLIWTDDSETPPPDWQEHAELTADGRALLIRPDKRRGLQPADMDAIEEFALQETR